ARVMEFDPGLSLTVRQDPMGFDYGPGVIGPVPEVRRPVISYDQKGTDVYYLNAPASGIYVKEKEHGSLVKEGECIGSILDPLQGGEPVKITAPADGWLFTTREYPVVDAGSLMGRILKQEVYERSQYGTQDII
ncbi:MAG: hypothetical protein IJ049_06225, partial [Oscillospiraceae bacterium]|nr:hypothetical protein [Oscillospiraceae bacterium]